METINGYIYIRNHPSYDEYNGCKMGKSINIPDRDTQYTTGEIKRGKFELVIEMSKDIIGIVEKMLQNYFNCLGFHIQYDGGTEFYKRDIINLIIPYLEKTNVKFKVLSTQEIEDLTRCTRIKKILNNKNIKIVFQNLQIKKNKNITYIPRPDQTIIINNSIKYFQTHDKGLLILMCGVGKTLISSWITQQLFSKTIIIGVPNTLLLEQWNKIITELFPKIPILIVSGGVSKNSIQLFLEKHIKYCIVITTYSSSHKLYSTTQNINFSFDMKILDECFPYNTGIHTNHGVIKIGKLYNMFERNQELPLILSFNETNGIFEYKKMTFSWRKQNKNLLKIQMSNKIIKCTENHRILSNKGYIEAIKLKENDLIISKYDTNNTNSIVAPCLNSDQLQLVYGSYLGSGLLSYTSNKRLKLKIIHCKKQKEYCLWKANLLNINNLTSKKTKYSFQSKIFDLDNPIPTDNKIVPDWLLDKIDERGIAIWFMDNGSINRNNNMFSITIHSNKYNKETHIKFINKFKKYNIDCYYSNLNEKYYCLKFNKVNSLKLLYLITPYIHSNFNYKISDLNLNTYTWNNNFLEYGTLKITKITNIINNSFYTNKPYVYDIEVEDNHNFIIGTIDNGYNNKYIDGPIVHNCHHLTTHNMLIANTKKTYVQMLNIPSVKQIALTATIKQLENINNDNDNNIISNYSVEHFGEIIDRKCLLWAIKNNIICDYVIQTIITDEEQLEQQLTKFHITEDNDKRLFLSAFASLKSIFEGHTHHLLIYSNSKEHSLKLINYIQILLDNNYFNIPDLYYSNYHSEMNIKEQKKIINNFNKTKLGIITCVYCLGEGYDNHNIDGVVFAENMSSNIRIVQSALRAGRKNKLEPNKITKIILPILNKNDWFENNDNTDLKKVREIIYQMGLEDETIIQKIKVFKINIEKQKSPFKYQHKDNNFEQFGEYEPELTQILKLKTINRTSLGITYSKARTIIADKNITSKQAYYELCDKDNRLTKEPETVFKGQFTNWIEYLSIERKYYDLETCKTKIAEYLLSYPEIKKHYLDLSFVSNELCKLDSNFPPNGLWVEYYNVKDLSEIVVITNKKKKIAVIF
jgi:superfamily II DNA or RNA helicase